MDTPPKVRVPLILDSGLFELRLSRRTPTKFITQAEYKNTNIKKLAMSKKDKYLKRKTK